MRYRFDRPEDLDSGDKLWMTDLVADVFLLIAVIALLV